MDDPKDSEDVKKYGLTFSLDRDRFFRRSCSNCGLSFKTKATLADIATAIQPTFREVGQDFGESLEVQLTSDGEEGENQLFCPYCGQNDKANNMLTDELSRYIKHYLMREYVFPKINGLLSEFSDSLSRQTRQPNALFPIEIIGDFRRTILPPRPISGPEPPDMIAVHFLCCDKYAKILENWIPMIICPFCGTQTVLH
jgi:hypothetical protein